jgi:hypothetical protein
MLAMFQVSTATRLGCLHFFIHPGGQHPRWSFLALLSMLEMWVIQSAQIIQAIRHYRSLKETIGRSAGNRVRR